MDNEEKSIADMLSEWLIRNRPSRYANRSDKLDQSDAVFNLSGLNLYDYNRLVQLATEDSSTYVDVYREYELMERDTIIQSALELYADDATSLSSESSRVISIESEDKLLENDLNDLVNSLSLDDKIWNWAYQLCLYGDHYVKVDFPETLTAPRLYDYDDPACILDIHELGDRLFYLEDRSANSSSIRIDNSMSRNIADSGYQVINSNELVHFMIRKSSNFSNISLQISSESDGKGNMAIRDYQVVRGSSILEPIRYIYRSLKLLEDSLIYVRLNKSQYARVFNVEVKDSSPKVTTETINDIKNLFDSRATFNTNTGSYQSNKLNRPHMDPIFNPVRDGLGSLTIDEIGGEVEVSAIADIDYFVNKLYGGLKIPKAFLGVEECFQYDTEVTLLNGSTVKIGDMANDPDKYVGKGILSCSPDGELIPTTITHVKKTRLDANFVRVHLDNGKYVDATPDHLMMMRDGTFKEAGSLTNGDSLMPYDYMYSGGYNHKVVEVEPLDIVEDAYDLGVAHENHTFCLAAGVFVHNSLGGGISDNSLVHLDLRYSRSVTRVIKAISRGIKDIINIWLVRRNRYNSINNYEVKIKVPNDSERLASINALSEVFSGISDIINSVSDTMGEYVNTPKLLKSLISVYISDSELLNLLSDDLDRAIDKYDQDIDSNQVNINEIDSEGGNLS